jgi:hypothetical protein
MKPVYIHGKALLWALIVVVALVLAFSLSAACARTKSQNEARMGALPATMGILEITLTNTGIRKTIGEADSGLWDVKVTNSGRGYRGVLMSGIDLCCTEYNRFSTLLRPGQTQTFRFYFAPGKVTFKDFTHARRVREGLVDVKWGGHSNSLIVK